MLLRGLEQKIIKIINESGMPIDAVYFIMKSLMQEIEQRYNEYCIKEDAENAQSIKELDDENEKFNSEEEKPVSADVKSDE